MKLSDPFTLKTPLDWLYSTQHFGMKLGLSNVEKLLSSLDLQPSGKVVQVAGTNGKGSTASLIESLAISHGIKTGVFTSPHLISFTERIKVNGVEIREKELEKRILEVQYLVKDWENHPTFFELSLALALMHFKDQKCELVILETGMGGRLDATTAVLKDVAVLTPIGMDHQQYLGDTIEEIAKEKAAIMREGKPCISAVQDSRATDVIEKMAKQRACPLQFITKELDAQYSLNLQGAHQRWNASLALEAFTACGYEVEEECLRQAFATVSWPARFQKITNDDEQTIIIDCAHNVQAIEVFIKTWIATFGDRKGHLVFGAAADKNITAVLRLLLPYCDSVEVYTLENPRGEKASNLVKMVNDIAPHIPCKPLEALKDYQKGDLTLVVGSVFLAGEWLKQYSRQPLLKK